MVFLLRFLCHDLCAVIAVISALRSLSCDLSAMVSLLWPLCYDLFVMVSCLHRFPFQLISSCFCFLDSLLQISMNHSPPHFLSPFRVALSVDIYIEGWGVRTQPGNALQEVCMQDEANRPYLGRTAALKWPPFLPARELEGPRVLMSWSWGCPAETPGNPPETPGNPCE